MNTKTKYKLHWEIKETNTHKTWLYKMRAHHQLLTVIRKQLVDNTLFYELSFARILLSQAKGTFNCNQPFQNRFYIQIFNKTFIFILFYMVFEYYCSSKFIITTKTFPKINLVEDSPKKRFPKKISCKKAANNLL